MLDSSTVMTPSLPTLSIASAIISPIWVSAAEIDAVADAVLVGLREEVGLPPARG